MRATSKIKRRQHSPSRRMYVATVPQRNRRQYGVNHDRIATNSGKWGKAFRQHIKIIQLQQNQPAVLSSLDVEHFHVSQHFKSVIMSMREYCVQFGTTLKESIKRISKLGAHYWEITIPMNQRPGTLFLKQRFR